MKFLITNMTGFRNKGCEAMTKVIVTELASRFSNTQFKIFSNDPAYDSLWMRSSINSRIMFLPTPSTIHDPLVRAYRIIRNTISLKTLKRSEDHFSWADAVISTGGDVFSSYYRNLEHHLTFIRSATRARKPVILLAHSIGPFKSEREQKLFEDAMRKVPLITIRESLSFEYVCKMDLENTNVELTADTAFLLPPANSKIIDRLWQVYHLPFDKPVVGIAPSQGITYYSKSSYEAHLKVLRDLIQYLTRKLDFHVILIPHVRENYVNNNDSILCSQIYRSLDFPSDVTVISLEHSTEELKGLIKRCDLIIAERMHAAIAALSQSIPALVIGYSIKARGILRDIFGDDINKYLVEIDTLSVQSLKYKVQQILEEQNTISAHLKRIMPRITKFAMKNFDLLEKLLKEGSL